MNDNNFSNRDKTVMLDLDSFQQSGKRHPYLLIYSGNASGCLYKLRKGTTTIGRSSQADITIGDSRISSRHCIIEWVGDEITIEDTGSSNGTYVDFQKVRHAILPHGVPIQLGQSMMKIEYKNEADIQSENKQRTSSSVDKVTGIFNLQHFIKLASMEIAYASRYDLPLGLIMMNIDNFRQVNDRYGHRAGDLVLSQVAQIVEEDKRSEDLFARYSRDEFIYLPRGNISKKFMRINCERHRIAIENYEFRVDEESIKITTSFGFHFKQIKRGNVDAILNDLICDANQALQKAKEKGKNRTACLL